MQFGRLSPEGKRNVQLALILMSRATPIEFEWLRSLNPIIAAQGGGCGCDELTVACTWIQWNKRIKIEFHHNPAEMSIVEIAKTLRHEARHYAPSRVPGYVVQVEHQCSDAGCQNIWQRAADPIYRADPEFHRIYGHHWMLYGLRIEADYDARVANEQAMRDRARSEAARQLLNGLGVTAGVLVLVAALAALSK